MKPLVLHLEEKTICAWFPFLTTYYTCWVKRITSNIPCIECLFHILYKYFCIAQWRIYKTLYTFILLCKVVSSHTMPHWQCCIKWTLKVCVWAALVSEYMGLFIVALAFIMLDWAYLKCRLRASHLQENGELIWKLLVYAWKVPWNYVPKSNFC